MKASISSFKIWDMRTIHHITMYCIVVYQLWDFGRYRFLHSGPELKRKQKELQVDAKAKERINI